MNTEGSPQDVNHWWASKTGRARLEFAKRHLKKPSHSSGTTSYGQMRPRSTCTRVMGREEYGEGKELLMILSIPPHQWSMVVVVSWRGHVWLPVELVLLYLLMMWLLTKAAGWILKCFGQYYLLIFSQMLLKLIDGASQCRWTMTQSILQKQPKSFWRERSGLLCNGQVNHLTWIRLSMHFTCWRQNWRKMPQEQAGTEDGCSRGLAEHHQGWTQRLVMSMRSRLQAVIDCKGFATKY